MEKKERHHQYSFLENAWIEKLWNQHMTTIDCHTKRNVFMKTNQQKLFTTHSKLFQASLYDLKFGNLRPTLSIHKYHKEMDAILFLGKQAANSNIERHHHHGTNDYHRSRGMPWWRSRLQRQLWTAMFSRPCAHQVRLFRAPIRFKDSSARYSVPCGNCGRQNIEEIAVEWTLFRAIVEGVLWQAHNCPIL